MRCRREARARTRPPTASEAPLSTCTRRGAPARWPARRFDGDWIQRGLDATPVDGALVRVESKEQRTHEPELTPAPTSDGGRRVAARVRSPRPGATAWTTFAATVGASAGGLTPIDALEIELAAPSLAGLTLLGRLDRAARLGTGTRARPALVIALGTFADGTSVAGAF